MSLPAVNPEALPGISLTKRKWIYGGLFLLVLAANCIDVFFDATDSRIPFDEPWWLGGALRVLALLSGVGNIIALANARPTIGEVAVQQAEAAVEYREDDVMDSRVYRDHELGHPEHLQTRPRTDREDDPTTPI